MERRERHLVAGVQDAGSVVAVVELELLCVELL